MEELFIHVGIDLLYLMCWKHLVLFCPYVSLVRHKSFWLAPQGAPLLGGNQNSKDLTPPQIGLLWINWTFQNHSVSIHHSLSPTLNKEGSPIVPPLKPHTVVLAAVHLSSSQDKIFKEYGWRTCCPSRPLSILSSLIIWELNSWPLLSWSQTSWPPLIQLAD